jgi:hypothetical protein
MLIPSSAEVLFRNTFTQVISIVSSAGTDTSSTSVVSDTPLVISDFDDPGITIIRAPGEVTLTGEYRTIIPIKWYWKDLNDVLQSSSDMPVPGTYLKIIQVDSPPEISVVCNYNISSSAGVDTFAHTVTLDDYGAIKKALLEALSGQPTPPMP